MSNQTQYIRVPAAATSDVYAVTPMTCVSAGPALLGGSVLIEFSADGRTNWQRWMPGTITQGGSMRPATNGYIRATAATQAASLFLVDMSGAESRKVDTLANVNSPLASANATSEQVLLSLRIPPLVLRPNFSLTFDMGFALTNNANVKTIRIRWGGVGGTALFTSPSVASALNYNALATISGRGDGSSLIGFGPGASGGWGISTTAYPTATAGYINQESEVVVTITKATGTDTGQLESALVSLY